MNEVYYIGFFFVEDIPLCYIIARH